MTSSFWSGNVQGVAHVPRVIVVITALAGLAALAYIGLIWWPSLQPPAP